MSDADCLIGDDAIHGEAAYTFGDEIDTLHGQRLKDEEHIAGTSSGSGEGISHPAAPEIGSKDQKQA